MSLKRWFDEKWVDVKTGKKCGRGANEKVDLTLLADHQKELVKKLQRLEMNYL